MKKFLSCILISVLLSSCLYLRSFPVEKAEQIHRKMMKQEDPYLLNNFQMTDDSVVITQSPEFMLNKYIRLENPVIATTRSNHQYLMSRSFYESYKGTERGLLMSDSAYIFAEEIPLRYYLSVDAPVSLGYSQLIYGEKLQSSGRLFDHATPITNPQQGTCFCVFNCTVDAYYGQFFVEDSHIELVDIPGGWKSEGAFVQIAIMSVRDVCQ